MDFSSESRWSCADICDALGDLVTYPESFPFQHFTEKKKFFGRIKTVKCFEDNSKVKEYLAIDGTGCVLIVDGDGSTRRALLGDMIAGSAERNNWNGIIINGVIRDSLALSKMNRLGVVALGTNPRKSEKKGIGSKDIQVRFHGVEFTPDHWVYVDHDGFVVSRSEL
jgi:regulator of ribonuclease activity A